jgi:hypothetical protein
MRTGSRFTPLTSSPPSSCEIDTLTPNYGEMREYRMGVRSEVATLYAAMKSTNVYRHAVARAGEVRDDIAASALLVR